jgi:hypothetical protein
MLKISVHCVLQRIFLAPARKLFGGGVHECNMAFRVGDYDGVRDAGQHPESRSAPTRPEPVAFVVLT